MNSISAQSPRDAASRAPRQSIAVVGMVVLGACGVFPTEPPGESPELTGIITLLEAGAVGKAPVPVREPRVINTILVEEEPDVWKPSLPQSKKSYFWITEDTSILIEQVDGGWREGTVHDLKVDARASAWYHPDGLVLQSYPSKGTASHIAVQR